MIAFAHHRTRSDQDSRGSLPDIAMKKPSTSIRRRSRVNPVFIVAGFSTALLFDALSSATARRVFHRVSEELLANPVAAIAAALVLALAAYQIVRVAVACFARSRSVDRIARAKD
jgi:hypothetical protein